MGFWSNDVFVQGIIDGCLSMPFDTQQCSWVNRPMCLQLMRQAIGSTAIAFPGQGWLWKVHLASLLHSGNNGCMWRHARRYQGSGDTMLPKRGAAFTLQQIATSSVLKKHKTAITVLLINNSGSDYHCHLKGYTVHIIRLHSQSISYTSHINLSQLRKQWIGPICRQGSQTCKVQRFIAKTEALFI